VTDDGSRERSSMLITSRGTCTGQTITVKRVVLGPVPYEYCWCENAAVNDGDILLASGTGRGIRSNGAITLTNASTNIPTGGWAYSTFAGAGVVAPKYTYTPKIRFPDIDLSYYASIATGTFGSPTDTVDVNLTSMNFSGGGGVIFVYGNVNSVQSTSYNGNWIVVATHDINMGCPFSASNSNSYLALIAGNNISISTSGSSASDRLDAVVYAPIGQINLYGSHYFYTIKDNDIYINGSMACNSFSTSGDGAALTVHMTYDSRLTLYVLRDRLKLPGL
jgi:hypothetical protein